MQNTLRHAHTTIALLVLMSVLLASCGLGKAAPTPTPNLQGTSQAASLEQTMTALAVTVQAYSGAQTEAAVPTATPTPIPTATVTPGPRVIRDDFSADVGRWNDCGQCTIAGGMMQMGPYPVSDNAQGYITLCADCGIVQDYKMGVDLVYKEGYSDRGFGLVLREQGGTYVDLELTTWQVYGVWFYDPRKGGGWNAWSSLFSGGWKPSGYLNPAQLSNRVDVEAATNGDKSNLAIRINGQLVNTVEIPAIPARVGLVIGLHSLGIGFDNFYFEGDPVDQPVLPSAGTGGLARK